MPDALTALTSGEMALLREAIDRFDRIGRPTPLFATARGVVDMTIRLGRDAAGESEAMSSADGLVPIAEVARILQKSKEACRLWARRNGIAVKIGSRVFVRADRVAARTRASTGDEAL